MIQIYNTLTRQKEEFKPIEEDKVKMYVCGPTVYNYIHIGNARSSVAFDTIRRYLEYRGYEVTYISNFTDVDDKIVKGAREEGLSEKDLADKYIKAFKEDTGAINVKPATIHPRVMEHIPEIIAFVQGIIDQDMAYESDGDVYFRAREFKNYGKLSGQSLDELVIGASQRTDDADQARKEDPLDFALWKKVDSEDEIRWESPWSLGRPGWHIECSVMATEHLGNTMDIHGGGQDLQFPHHENEIAQAEAKTGETFVNYWMHNGFVTLGDDGEKMSKSLGNFVLLRDLLKESDPMVVRYLLATVHYRRPLRYDSAALAEAEANVKRLRELFRRIDYRLADSSGDEFNYDSEFLAKVEEHEAQFIKQMDDDFNAANGITEVFNLVKTINLYLEKEKVSRNVLVKMEETLERLLDVFGLDLHEDDELVDEDIQALIDERNEARANRDFARADSIRDQLKDQGILLDDTPQGTQWKRGN